MNDKIEQRMQQLLAEYESGQKMLAEIDAKRQQLQATLLRIEGALQVLREMTQPQAASDSAP